MTTTAMKPRVTSFAPQFLVDDLERSIAYYEKLGFTFLSPDHAQPGNGLLLFFRVDDFDMALPRARALVARLEEEPHVNPNTGTTEFSLRDPEGYYVTISALSAA
jgi:catechol 2,3-dioxygenase-like lactoylglutathione lyase family enzyme